MVLRLMLILAIAASGLTAGQSARAAASTSGTSDDHACCTTDTPASHDNEKEPDPNDCCGSACLMLCCRTVTPPVGTDATLLDVAPLAIRIVLPLLHADDLGEPQSIFHPPRA